MTERRCGTCQHMRSGHCLWTLDRADVPFWLEATQSVWDDEGTTCPTWQPKEDGDA